MADANTKVTTHGNFNDVAKLTMTLKDAVQVSGADVLDPPSREALDQILSRIARIVCGDQTHRKHWEDIQGFCQVKLDSLPAPTLGIEGDIQRLVRTLPVATRKNWTDPNDAPDLSTPEYQAKFRAT